MSETQTPKGGKLAAGKSDLPPPPGPPWASAEKPKNFAASMRLLFSYMGAYKWAFIIGITMTIVSVGLASVGPGLLKDVSDAIYDGIGGEMDTDRILELALIILAIYSVSALLRTAEHYIIPATSERVANKIRTDLNEKIGRLPLNYYDNSSTGDIMSRLTNDADTVGMQCGSSFNSMAVALTTLIGCMAMMFYINAELAVVCIIPPVAGFVVMRVIIRRTHRLYVQQSRYLGSMNGLVEEVYYGHAVVGAYGAEKACRDRFLDINDGIYSTFYKTRFITSTMPQLMGFVGNIGYVLVCIIGSMMVIRGEITYGVIVAFIIYVRMFNSPLLMLTDSIGSMQSLAASTERIFDLLLAPEMEDESSKGGPEGEVRGDIEFRDISFSYVEGVEVIHHFSLEVKAGQRIAIVGPTGAGKTTVVNLLMRFYELDSGSILIDGVPTTDMRRKDVHDMFSMVLQDPWLFEGTVMENLKFNNADADDAAVEEACRAVGIHDYIMTLPDGYGTVIGDRTGMSAGQKQQITIARAIIKDAPMVIFDEATSSVDTRTEKRIQAAMETLTAGRTSFIIAHRLSTIRDCDLILVMRDGRIVETGTHESLLASGGFYRELYDSQFENCA